MLAGSEPGKPGLVRDRPLKLLGVIAAIVNPAWPSRLELVEAGVDPVFIGGKTRVTHRSARRGVPEERISPALELLRRGVGHQDLFGPPARRVAAYNTWRPAAASN